jgi:hypothetical protein
MFQDLSGKVAVVTSESRCLERHLCNFLSERNVRVIKYRK